MLIYIDTLKKQLHCEFCSDRIPDIDQGEDDSAAIDGLDWEGTAIIFCNTKCENDWKKEDAAIKAL